MAKVGRGNKAIDTIDPTLRARLDDLLDSGTDVTTIYEEYPAVQAAMSLRTLQEYAKERRRERKVQISLDACAVLDQLLEALDVDRATLTRIEYLTLGTAMKEMIDAGKTRGRLGGLAAVLQIRKDRRKTEEHSIRMKLGSIKAIVEQRALDAQSGKKSKKTDAEAYAEIGKMLDDVIRDRDVA